MKDHLSCSNSKSIIQEHRGAALGFFNLGIYLGYSMSYTLIIACNNHGWRTTYFVAGTPGIIMAIVILLTVNEPMRNDGKEGNQVRIY